MTDPFVLFVDDSRMCSLITCEILRDHGFNVLETHSAEEAYAALAGPAVLVALVTDVDLGEGDNGFDIARRARTLRPMLPVVYVSGSDPARHPAEGVVGSEFIAKPFRRQRIIEALTRVVGVRSAAEKIEEDRRAVAQFLGLVPSGHVVGGREAPIVRVPGGPVEEAAGQDPLQGPVGIAGDIRREA